MLDLAWPWVFALLPLPWVLRALLPPSESSQAALKVSFLDDLQMLNSRRPRIVLPRWRQQLPYLAIWLLLLLAAARPQWLGEPLPLPSTGRDLMLAVDISGSMDYPDMRWQGMEVTRLEIVQRLFGEFVEQRHGDRIGLILFGSKAYLHAPLTFDRTTVRTWLEEAVVGIAGSNTAIGDAIGLAVKHLRERPAQSRVLVLITDGANNGGQIDPQVAARLAADENLRIYTIGIGAAPDASGASLFGFDPALDLDEPSLRAIADQTGGEYFHGGSSEQIEVIGTTLNRLEPAAQEPAQSRFAQPLYPWPLGTALLASLILALTAVDPASRPRWRRLARP
ncbi:vWA domain-containing protein [Stutzerimonas tarimensis]|uniref:VWA domain-containing protein n=1 Tax=Stutzerimonas tarimensis TaxID=1507735 RepID=A0ABV7T406_9GAMM